MMNSSIIMFWRQSILEEYVKNIREEGFDVNLFDCKTWDKNNYLLEIGTFLSSQTTTGKT